MARRIFQFKEVAATEVVTTEIKSFTGLLTIADMTNKVLSFAKCENETLTVISATTTITATDTPAKLSYYFASNKLTIKNSTAAAISVRIVKDDLID